MKIKKYIITIIFILITTILSMKANAQNFYCKYCGVRFSSIMSLTRNSCNYSPTKYHVLYEGSERNQYTCKYCGIKYNNLQTLVKNTCQRNPQGKYHSPILEEKEEDKNMAICKYCGVQYTSVMALVRNQCNYSPTKYHVVYEGAEKIEYTCKYCGIKYKNFQSLVRNFCQRNPEGKYHSPTL